MKETSQKTTYCTIYLIVSNPERENLQGLKKTVVAWGLGWKQGLPVNGLWDFIRVVGIF